MLASSIAQGVELDFESRWNSENCNRVAVVSILPPPRGVTYGEHVAPQFLRMSAFVFL